MGNVFIEQKTRDSFLNLILDTLHKQKQALVFVNTKKSAEKQAEDIAKYLKRGSTTHEELAKKILSVLAAPTQQCARLAGCIKAGIAFHHSGLHTKQREIIEEAFKRKDITIICATPTLAAGVDLPAFRAIIKDIKRFG
ncbi:MAG: helicase-related protein [Nanoarchaeota archaeon]